MSTITNFRDLGGIKNKDNQQVKSKTFLRSGELSALSKEQSQHLEDEYKLKKIVDFRSEKEVEERPDVIVPSTKYIHIDILADIEDQGASVGDFVKIGSPEKSKEYLQSLYQSIALDEVAQKGYQHFFDEILSLNEEQSLLFHCFAGKDRTGIGAVLILEALDVPKDAIYSDYLITNLLRKQENSWLLEQGKEQGLESHHLEALNVALNVDQSYLDEFYQTVKQNYGDVQNYLTNAIGVKKGMKTELKKRFLI